jgi:hypothetical protein
MTLFSRPKPPQIEVPKPAEELPPPPPLPPLPPPAKEAPKVQEAEAATRRRERGRGRASTVLSNPSGVGGSTAAPRAIVGQ